MSEVEKYTLEGYAFPDPTDETRVLLRFEISVPKMIVESGFVPKFARMKNWNGIGSACAGIREWLRAEAFRCGKEIYVANKLSTAEATAIAEFESIA